MERDFYNEEFEDLIREKTDQYKMYPSDKVWKEIHGSLHTRKRRYVVGMSVLISGILIIAGKELLTPAKRVPAQKQIEQTVAPVAGPEEISANVLTAFKKSPLSHQSLVPTLPEKLEEKTAEQADEASGFPESEAFISPVHSINRENQEHLIQNRSLSGTNLPSIDVLPLSLNIAVSDPDIVDSSLSSIEDAAQKITLRNYNEEDKETAFLDAGSCYTAFIASQAA